MGVERMDPVQYGQLIQKVETLEKSHERFQLQLDGVDKKLDQLLVANAQQEGASRINKVWSMATVALASAVVSGCVTIAAEYMKDNANGSTNSVQQAPRPGR